MVMRWERVMVGVRGRGWKRRDSGAIFLFFRVGWLSFLFGWAGGSGGGGEKGFVDFG
jgi:hypothetical protein